MYGEYSKSIGPKLLLTALHAVSLYIVFWLLFQGGLVALALYTGRSFLPGALDSRALLFSCAVVYSLRVTFRYFSLMRRRMRWNEAASTGFFVFLVHIYFALLGGTNPLGIGAIAGVGALLYVAGSFLNTASEYARHRWKQEPGHEGKLYVGGLFRYSRHINYFGDEILFIGYALVTHSAWALIVPAFVFVGFIMGNIPALDRYLAQKYGDEFEAYAQHTKKFIPLVY